MEKEPSRTAGAYGAETFDVSLDGLDISSGDPSDLSNTSCQENANLTVLSGDSVLSGDAVPSGDKEEKCSLESPTNSDVQG